ncbi:MAG: hypothetical protein HFH45_06220 [Bacilli bacterium]|nr:hypothetical protein [Bacilli bacterium]
MSEKGKTVLVYILLFIIIILVIGLISYAFLSKNNGSSKGVKHYANPSDLDISSECTFEMTWREFNSIKGNTPENFCSTLNLIKLTDVVLDGESKPIEIVYSDLKVLLDDTNTGFYINDNRMTRYASTDFINTVGVFDDKFFILTVTEKGTNVTVFNSNMEKVYDLESVLKKNNITDPAFVELAKTNSNLKTNLEISKIDSSTMNFVNGQFTFASNSKLGCEGNSYLGSNYKVTYVGDDFTVPEFVSPNSCAQ